MAKQKREDPTDWRTAGKRTLTTALNRLDDLAQEATDPVRLESIIKTVGDIVGAAEYTGRGKTVASGGGGAGDDDE